MDADRIPPLSNELKILIKKFIKGLLINLKNKSRFTDELKAQNRLSYSTEDFSIILIENEVKDYLSIVEKLRNVYPYSQKYGKSYAGDTLKDAISSAVKSTKDIHLATSEAIELIQTKYSIELTNWDLFFPVSGIDFKNKTTWEFGQVTFYKNNNRRLQNISKKITFQNLLGGRIRVFVNCKIKAADMDSAIKLAEPIVDLHVSVLNAFSTISGNAKHKDTSSMYMDFGENISSSFFCETENERYGWRRYISLNLAGFNPHLLNGSTFIKKFRPNTISRELKKTKNEITAKRIIPALKWIGKAVLQKTNEEIFLYYLIALESIVFKEKHTVDDKVVDPLIKRTGKLLFYKGYLSSSLNGFEKIEYLYDLRSRIVHRGGTEISDDDIYLAKQLAVGCIYKLMTRSLPKKIKKINDFELWLDSE